MYETFIVYLLFIPENMSENNAKPNVSLDQATELLSKLYDLTATEIHSLPSYDDQNFYTSANNGHEYLLKITNTKDSENPNLIEIQTYTMSYLQENGISTQNVLPTNTGKLWSIQEIGETYF